MKVQQYLTISHVFLVNSGELKLFYYSYIGELRVIPLSQCLISYILIACVIPHFPAGLITPAGHSGSFYENREVRR